MSTIAHIPASQITELTTLYIDAKMGTVLSIDENGVDDLLWITFEDPNGEHVISVGEDETVPTLVG